MTVEEQTSKISYVADGSTSSWPFPFSVFEASDLVVYLVNPADGSTTVLNPAVYTVIVNPPIDPNPTPIGGLVIFPLIGHLAVGNSITITRRLPLTQSVSLANQGTLYPKVIEGEFDYLTLLDQQGSTPSVLNAFTASPIDPTPNPTVPIAQRRNQWVSFDNNGDLTAAMAPDGAVPISAAMQPVVGASTLALARQLLGVSIPALHITVPMTLTNDNNRQIITLGGNAFYAIGVGAATTYDPTFWVFLFNEDNRGKLIVISGIASFILWPTQQIWLSQDGTGAWFVTDPGRWRGSSNFYVHATLGSNSNDGLQPGADAFQTINHAVDVVQNETDGSFPINLDPSALHNVSGGIFVDGNNANPRVTIIGFDAGVIGTADLFTTLYGGNLSIDNVRLATNGGSGLVAQYGGVINATNIDFHACSNSHVIATNGSIVVLGGTLTISAAASSHLGSTFFSTIYYNSATVGIAVPVSIPNFIICQAAGVVAAGTTVTFANSAFVTGQQWNISYNSVIFGSGTVWPGTIAGDTNTGSWSV